MRAKRFLLLTILCCTLSLSYSQTIIGRQNVDQYPVTGWGTMTYGLTWLPTDYSTNLTQKYPLLIFLHGVGETGNGTGGLYTLLNTGLPQTIAQGWDPEAVNPVDNQNYKFIVVSPQASTSVGWSYQWNALQYLLPDVINRYRIDTTRIYITGLSAGGNGTWTCLTSGPQAARKFAAAVPIASAPLPLDSIAKVGSEYGVKLWQLCGDADAFFNFSTSSTASYNSGTPVPNPQSTLTVFPGQGHWPSVWNTAYDPTWRANTHNLNIYEWMLQYKRTAVTNSVLAVNAGTDQTITAPQSSVTLSGAAQPPTGATISTYSWSKIGGAAGDAITNQSSAATTVTNLSTGSYSYRLFVTASNGDTAADTVQVTVNAAANLAPIVSAGADSVITLPRDSTMLLGTATDADGTISSYQWSVVSGPTSYVIASATQPQTLLGGLVAGVYKMELAVTDNGGAVAKDTVMVTVNAAATTPSNLPPSSFAGPDISIMLPTDSIQLNGLGTDTDGTIASYHWTKISGPAAAIQQADSAATMVHNLVAGTYSFEFRVTDDSGAVDADTMLVVVSNASTSGCNGVRRYMIPGGDHGKQISGDPASWWYQPVNAGDTIVLQSQHSWTYLRMENYSGTSACPIVVINQGGQVWMRDGIDATNCSHLKITGSGSANNYYGFKVYNPVFDGYSVAIGFSGRAKNFEVERVDVLHKGYGVWAKQDPQCDPAYNYPNYVMDSVEIHHCRFRRIWQDCIYAGNTDPLGERIVMCNGVETHPIPMRMSNVNIHHLIIDSCGRTGIQLSGADAGINSIHHNIVTNCGYEYNQWQGTGISIGGMTRNCYVYNNTVKNTFLYGIFDLGADSSFVFNNIVDSSGYLKIDPSVNISALAASTNTTALPGGWLKNTMSMPGNIQTTTRNSIPHYTKTVFYKNNRVGKNASTFAPEGLIAFGWWGPAEDWTTHNQVCSNTRLDGTTPAKIDPFWYTTLNQYWPVYDSTCSSAVPNVPPVANAGIDTVLNASAVSVLLQGSGSDPDGTITSYHWEKISGPAAYNFTQPDSAHTVVTGLVPGIYTFRLKVTDNAGASATDEVEVSLAAPNDPPIANAGPFKVVTLPQTSTTIQGSATDPNGDAVSYQWTLVSGPATYTIANATEPVTALSNLVPGTYWFRLTTTDSHGATDTDTTRVDVNIAPSLTASADQTITLPVNAVTVTGWGSDVDGTIAGYTWTKISGPSQYTIVSPYSAQTDITNLVVGVYKFELKVTDNFDAAARDTVTITVLQGANNPPIANAGADVTIQLPVDQAQLNGSGMDADGSIVSYLWSYVSGPATYNITTAGAAQTMITGLAQGTYIFQLTVTDNNGAASSDQVVVTVNPPAPANNIPPVSNAGSDITLILPQSSTTLNGSATDADGTIASYLWSKISGPLPSQVNQPSQPQTAVTGLVQGVYLFQLQVIDNNGSVALDTVQVTVLAAPNVKPVANAGSDITIQLPQNFTTLTGSGTDADGSIVSYQWTKIWGPATYTMATPAQAQTAINSLVPGAYQFELQVTDDMGSLGFDTVTVTVLAAPLPPPNNLPTVFAGNDQSITLPQNSVMLNGTAADSDGAISSWQWTVVSGPQQFVISSPMQASTALAGLTNGVYKLELMVTDNAGGTARDTVFVIVSAANLPPVANAGLDQVITLPVTAATLSGSGVDPDGTVTSYQWSFVNGPVTAVLSNGTAAQTNATGMLQTGAYTYVLTITDNSGATGSDTVNITVMPAPNMPPVAHAGADQLITLPVTTTILNGSGTDGDGTVVSYHWTTISGPSPASVSNAAAAQTMVTALTQAGVYGFELTVTDNGGATARDTVYVTVMPPVNTAPVVHAGSDQTIVLPANAVTLNGSATDADGTVVSYLWNKIAGPVMFNILSPSSAQTVVNAMLQPGVYVYELTATDDDGATGKDTVQVIVQAASANAAPVVNAGLDAAVYLPYDTITLKGSATDADGTVVSYKWIKIGGPVSFTMTSPSAPVNFVSGLTEGEYLFELLAVDNWGAIGRDTVKVVVANNGRINTTTVLYPNPATDQVHLRIVAQTERAQSLIQIFDNGGRLVYSESFMRNGRIIEKTIPVYMLISGHYFVKVQVDIDTVAGLRFIRK